jgi:hypothetical protein
MCHTKKQGRRIKKHWIYRKAAKAAEGRRENLERNLVLRIDWLAVSHNKPPGC